MDDKDLIREALAARKNAYVPYSGFAVGAALLTSDGKVYHGCNIESASYSPTNCAERTAFFKAVSEGVRSFAKIAVVGAFVTSEPSKFGFAFPCGVCRQVMREFCDKDKFTIITAASENNYIVNTLDELLPNGFGPESLANQ